MNVGDWTGSEFWAWGGNLPRQCDFDRFEEFASGCRAEAVEEQTRHDRTRKSSSQSNHTVKIIAVISRIPFNFLSVRLCPSSNLLASYLLTLVSPFASLLSSLPLPRAADFERRLAFVCVITFSLFVELSSPPLHHHLSHTLSPRFGPSSPSF